MAVGDGMWVTVRYRLFDSQGEPLEEGERELTYLQGGSGVVLPKIESALEGGEPGFSTSIYLQPEDAFGDYDAQLVSLAPREEFPAELEVGMTFERLPGDGGAEGGEETAAGIYTVTDFTEEAVVLDGNHPLAGMALRFDLKLVAVRPATAEELERERAQRADAGSGAESDGDSDGQPDDDGQPDQDKAPVRRTLH